ncbi:CoA pyrophosphatase [Aliiglaciecola sp. CAU 1673]|uniref:CoA pyrophosphatase n=1 Tax=Aliiglaciecola sp. CAU 1673 TaxID=3032595 RepID=UPI0023DB2A5C|nr:CoA pyrophosphatase [Aliiglaciecola sp. CAU 1673]MDF2178889.1 CoA pyrophosphatase [Aliiglaciecola sp. CAU 1673]
MTRDEFLNRFHHLRQVRPEPDFPLPKQGLPAAVLIPLIDRPALTMLFTRRAAHLKHHGGQISFPGGRQEPQDEDLVVTALRETEEEIGLPPTEVEIVGQLERYRTVSGYEVTPFIGLISPPLVLEPDYNEVASIFEVPMSYLMDKANHNVHVVNRNGYAHPIYFIHWQQQHIWGATAAFVRNLANHMDI